MLGEHVATLVIVEHTVHRIDDAKTQPAMIRLSSEPEDTQGELVISNTRHFSVVVGLLGAHGRKSDDQKSISPSGAILHAHAELLYENGAPTEGMLKGETVRPFVDGEASFRLRVTALSSRMNNTRFRVRVTVPTHGNPHLPPLLSVLTQPMRSITKLAPKVRNAASLTPTLPGPSSADELSGSNSLTGSASMLNTGTPLLTYSAAMAVHDGSHVFGGVHLERTPSFADFESSAPQTASEASLAPSDCTASPMQRRLKRQRHQQCSVKTEVLDDNHPTFFLNLQGDNGASLKKSKRWQSRFLGLSRLSSNGAAKEEDVEEEGSAQEAEPFFAAALSQLGADAGKDDSLDGFIAAFHDRGGVISEELDSLMSGWPTEMLDLSDDEELGKCARGFAGLPERQKSTHALSAGAACEAEHAVDAVREFVFPPAMVKAQALPSRLPMRVHLVSTGHGTNMSGRRQLEPWLPGTQPASLVKTEKLCKPPNMPQVTQLSTLQTEFEQLKESLASFIGALSAKRAAVC